MENASNLFKLTYTLLWLICDHLSWNSILAENFFIAWDLQRSAEKSLYKGIYHCAFQNVPANHKEMEA